VQLSDEALLQLAELGYSHKAASRALRFSGGNVAAAVDFLTAQQEKKQVRPHASMYISCIHMSSCAT